MSTEFPLFPELSEQGKKEAEAAIEQFKTKMKRAAEDVLGEVYCGISDHIESDAWTNFRNSLMDGFRNYGNRKLQADYDFKQIRAQIYFDFREEIIKDLDQDNLAKIEDLKKEIAHLREMLESRYR